jgi:hypothetical protein
MIDWEQTVKEISKSLSQGRGGKAVTGIGQTLAFIYATGIQPRWEKVSGLAAQ